ncbi:MAG: TolC family protein [Bacteroidales bacterium]|nr:TolC family protein [Bacteroidales bacterium]
MRTRIMASALLLTLIYGPAQAQVQDVLRTIEENNPELRIASEQLGLEKLENREAALWADPEIELAYLWGQGSQTRRNLGVSQSFDIPALTGMRKDLASRQDEMSVLKYKAKRLNILLEAKNLCIELIYCNMLYSELEAHLHNAEDLVTKTEKKMDLGGADILEAKKARLHMASVKGKMSKIDVDRRKILSELSRLGGGKEICLDATSYDISESLPSSFEDWYAVAADKNPVLKYVQASIDASKVSQKIDRRAALPSLTIGYTSEITADAGLRGVSMGISIPLWRNTNRIRQADAAVRIAESRKQKEEVDFYNRLLSDYENASGLKAVAEDYRQALENADNRKILMESMSKGEISMIDYIVESDLYYDALEEYMKSERDFRLALASLQSVLL